MCFGTLLFTLYTNDYINNYPGCSITTYTDDTAIIDKFSNDNYHEFLEQVNDFLLWSYSSFFNTNIIKTKEMVLDFGINNYSRSTYYRERTSGKSALIQIPWCIN